MTKLPREAELKHSGACTSADDPKCYQGDTGYSASPECKCCCHNQMTQELHEFCHNSNLFGDVCAYCRGVLYE